MTPRVDPRFKKRLSCRLKQKQRTYAGMVLDLSRTGLFVQTSAGAKPGDEVEVLLGGREQAAPVAVTAAVVWQRKAPHQLRAVVEGGVGLKIRYAPEPYYAILADAAQGATGRRHRSV
jgi:Tfp pilus assembly protein PilZ